VFFSDAFRRQRTVKQTVQTSRKSPENSVYQPTGGSILLSAAELFAGRKGHNTNEIKVFLELAGNFLPATPVRDRRDIANLLATHPDTPPELLQMLARDSDALTAYPVLRHAELSVDLLIETVESGPESARKAVAGRDMLAAPVLAALCDNSAAATIRLLLDREDLSPDYRLNERLSRRRDLMAELGLELSARQTLCSKGLMQQFLYLPASLRPKAIAAAETLSLIKQAQAPMPAKIPALDTTRLRLHGALRKAALLQKRSRFAASLGQYLGLPGSISDMLLYDGQEAALVIALKALGMDRSNTTTILVCLLGERLPLQEIRKLLFLHRNLSSGAAETLVGSWPLLETGPELEIRQTARHASQYEDTKRMAREPRAHRTNAGPVSATRTRRPASKGL
jgi:uncharacterized protein (DUF2336 family)